MGRFRSITHPFAARQPVLLQLVPFDLHVLGTPPAFNLSQDQTLHLKILRIIEVRVDPKWLQLLYLLDILVTQVFAPRHRRESPHKLPAKLLKSTRSRGGLGKYRPQITPPEAFLTLQVRGRA